MGHRLHLAFQHHAALQERPTMEKAAALCAAAAAHGGFLAIHAHSHIPSWTRAVYAPTERGAPPVDTMGKGRPPRRGQPDAHTPPQATHDPHHGLWARHATQAALLMEDVDREYARDAPRVLVHARGWVLCFEGAHDGAPWGTAHRCTPNAVLLHPPASAHEALHLHRALSEDLAAARGFLPWMASWWREVDAIDVQVLAHPSP